MLRAQLLRQETAVDSISPERAGSIMYDTLAYINLMQLLGANPLLISKIYASVAAMEADSAPVSDLTGQPLRPGQVVVIASTDSDNGSVYRYNGGTESRWTAVGKIGNLIFNTPVDSLASDSTQLPLAARQGKVLDEKVTALGRKVDDLALGKFYGFFPASANLPAGGEPGYAYVGASAPFAIYVFENGAWSDSGSVYSYPVGNGEDIDTNGAGQLQFANRPDTYGMGYKILRRDASFASQVTDVDTIYEIRYDFELNGSTVTIPENSSLNFVGGSINDGVLQLNEGCSVVSTDVGRLNDIAVVLLGKNISIENIEINSSVDAIRSNSIDVSGLRIRNCNIVATDNCVKLITDELIGILKDVEISGNQFRFHRMGIELQNHANDDYKINGFLIDGNYFVDAGNTDESDTYSTFALYCYAISVSGYGENGTISHNTFRAVSIGVEQVGFKRVNISDNLFIGNQVPMSFSNNREMPDCVVSNNVVRGGLVRFTNIQDSLIIGNDFDHVEDVYFSWSNRNKFTGNRIYALKVGDALFFDNSGYNLVTDNSIYHDNASGQAVIKFYAANSTGNICDGNGLWRNSSIGTWWTEQNSASNNKVYSWTNLGTAAKSDALVGDLSTVVNSNYTELSNKISAVGPLYLESSFKTLPFPYCLFYCSGGYNSAQNEIVIRILTDNWVGQGVFRISGKFWSGNNNVASGPYKFELTRCGYNMNQGINFTSDSTSIRATNSVADDGYYYDIIFSGLGGNRGWSIEGEIHKVSENVSVQIFTRAVTS